MSLLPRSVLDAGEFVRDETELEVALDRVLESAKELTGARYTALCVLNGARDGLAIFITAGIDDDTRARIGGWPRGRGVLGQLILDPVPLRLASLGQHPHCYGMPPGHPPMRSFLGVPILVDHVPDGSLYLTDKAGRRAFSDEDEKAVAVLAGFAGFAIERDRRHTKAAPASGGQSDQ
jgi:two-component system, NarL family, sensor histidine kinase DevS